VSAPGIVSVLRRRTFRYLFLGVTLSRIGDAMTFVVISWIALGIGGARAVGLVVFLGGVVQPFTAPVIGYLLDTLGLRRLLLVDNLFRGLLMLVLAYLVHVGHVKLWYLAVFAVLSAVLSPATEVGQNVAVPELLNTEELDAANRLLSATWDLSAWFGPAIAGFAIDGLGSAPVLVADAATFLTMALVALAMPGRPDHEETPSGPLSRGLLSGFKLLWTVRPILVMTLAVVGDMFFGGMVEVFLPAFNKLTLHQGAAAYGLMISFAGVASLVGTMLLSTWLTKLGYGRALICGLLLRGLLFAPVAIAGNWALAAIFVAASAVPDGAFFPIARTVQQRLVPKGVRGRVQGAKSTLGVAGFPLGSAIGGLLIGAFGPRPVAVVIALGYLPIALAIQLTPHIMSGDPVPAEIVDAAVATAATDPVTS